MSARINKYITWNEKEYAHIIEDKPNQFCDLCAFGEICQKVLLKTLEFSESPMKVCEELCDAENTHFAMFVPGEVAEKYVRTVNSWK